MMMMIHDQFGRNINVMIKINKKCFRLVNTYSCTQKTALSSNKVL